jgi:hypothetical protein
MPGRWLRMTVDGATALASLSDDVAPKAAAAFWESLPLETSLTHTKWCGAAASFVPGASLASATELEDAVCSLYPGVLAIRPGGGEALLSYGDAECRSELGVEYANRVAQVIDGEALFARLRRMWEEGDARIRIERAERPESWKAAARLIEVEVEGTKAMYALRTDTAPRTCALLWDLLPIETTTFYSRWAGDAGIVETRPERVKDLLLGELEAPAISMYKGTLCCGPTPNWMDIYLSFGAAECRGAQGRRYITVAADVQGDPSALFDLLKRTRREGEKRVVIRRVERA